MNYAAAVGPTGKVVRRTVREARSMLPRETPSDEHLLRRVAFGNAEAFELIYRRHARAIMTIAFRVLDDRESAADVTQTVFLRLWQQSSRLSVRSGSIRGWLITVARNAALDVLRARRPQATPYGQDAPDIADSSEPSIQVIADFRTRAVRDVIDLLNEDQRTVIELAFFGDLTQSAIAECTGMPLGTVKSRLRLAMQHLRTALAGREWMNHD